MLASECCPEISVPRTASDRNFLIERTGAMGRFEDVGVPMVSPDLQWRLCLFCSKTWGVVFVELGALLQKFGPESQGSH